MQGLLPPEKGPRYLEAILYHPGYLEFHHTHMRSLSRLLASPSMYH